MIFYLVVYFYGGFMGIETNTIAEMIVYLRKKKHLTQKQLGDKLGVSNKTISKWETGVSIPDSFYLPKLSKIFNITIDELMNGRINKTQIITFLSILFLLSVIIEVIICILNYFLILSFIFFEFRLMIVLAVILFYVKILANHRMKIILFLFTISLLIEAIILMIITL